MGYEPEQLSKTPRPIRSVFTALNINAWKSGSAAHYTSNDELAGAAKALETTALYVRDRLGGFPGVVGFQELADNVDAAGKGFGTMDQSATIATYLGEDWTAIYGRTVGEENARNGGNALLSDATVEKRQIWRFAHDPKNEADYGKYPRGATAIKLAFPGSKKLWAVCTHLDGVHVSIRQLFQLLGRAKTFDPDFPTIVMGDMNIKGIGQGATPEAFEVFDSVFQLAGFTRLVRQSKVYIYLYDPHSRLEVLEPRHEPAEYGGIKFSDHAVVSARFAWR